MSKDKGLSKNARVSMRGKQGKKFFNGQSVRPVSIRAVAGKSMTGVFDEASGSLLMSDSSDNKKTFVSWDSIAGLITDTQ